MIKDTHELNGFNTIKFPKLKGHVKLTLHNVHNKKNEVYEGDNIVTNAVADIFANNYLGMVDYNKIIGSEGIWKKWFGGVLCFQNAHPDLTATNYYPQNKVNNPVTAHAGQTSIDSDHDDDNSRGNPTASAYTTSENSVKMVWEWGTTHGNGQISALSLTHTDVGSYGLGSESYHFQNTFEPLEDIRNASLPNSNYAVVSPQNIFGQYDDNHGYWFAIGEEDEFSASGNHTIFGTNKLTIYIKRLPYAKAGLFETAQVREDYPQSFTVEFSNTNKIGTETYFLYAQPCYHFDYTNKILWIFSNRINDNTTYQGGESSYSKTYIKYAKIDCVNQTVLEEGRLQCTSNNLSPIPFALNESYTTNCPYNYNIICDGTYAWFPITNNITPDWYASRFTINSNKMVKITISNNNNYLSAFNTSIKQSIGGTVKSGELLIVTGGYEGSQSDRRCVIVNDDTGYMCKATYGAIGSDNNLLRTISEPYSPSFVMLGVGARNGGTFAKHILANKMLLTTKYNLQGGAVTKSASQSMTVEYTLTEQEPE